MPSGVMNWQGNTPRRIFVFSTESARWAPAVLVLYTVSGLAFGHPSVLWCRWAREMEVSETHLTPWTEADETEPCRNRCETEWEIMRYAEINETIRRSGHFLHLDTFYFFESMKIVKQILECSNELVERGLLWTRSSNSGRRNQWQRRNSDSEVP
jgi:hypothetical protein